MKLGLWALASPISAMTPMEKMQAIVHAHSTIRNAYNRPQFNQFKKEHEKLVNKFITDGSRSDPEFIMIEAANLTSRFRSEAEGTIVGQFPSLDGSGNDLTGALRGKVGDKYSRLTPTDYCQFDKHGDPASDIMGEPRCINHLSQSGSPPTRLPNERELSLLLTESNSNNMQTTTDSTNTMVGPLWGQFVTHDIIQTPDMGDGEETPCDCSDIPKCKNIFVNRTTDPVFDDIDCMFVIRSAPHVPSEGNFVREQMNQKTSFMDLSQIYGATEDELKELIDNDQIHLKTRRGFDGANGPVGDILPFTQDAKSSAFADKFKQPATFNDDNFKDFIAGDNRVQENPYLASFHTVFLRYHNEVATQLRKLRSDWTKREVFENARLITISVYKNIHYGEALPAMLGTKINGVAKLRFVNQNAQRRQLEARTEITEAEFDAGKRPLNPWQKRPNKQLLRQVLDAEEEGDVERMSSRITGHNPPHEAEPSIRNEFAAAAYRMHGQVKALMKAFDEQWRTIAHAHADETHSGENEGLLPGEREFLDDNPGMGLMKFNFFDPEWVHRKGPGGCLRGAMKSNQLKMDGTFDTDLQHFLFKPDNWHHGVDLFAINIARGREHGLGSYGAVKSFCKSHRIYSKFYKNMQTDSALFHSLSQIKKVREKYISKANASKVSKTQDDFIDLYVGMQLEKHMDDGTVGPTAGCVIAEQFVALKEGDRFWFESFGVFSPEQLAEIRKMTMASVACQTFEGAGGKTMDGNNFMAIDPWKMSGDRPGANNNLKKCSDFPQIDFTKWARSETDTEKEPVVVACIWANRPKTIDCSGMEWSDKELEAYIKSVTTNRRFPILGKRNLIEFKAKHLVQRISLANNDIRNMELVERLASHAKNSLLELSVASNKNLNSTVDSVLPKFRDYPKLGHMDMGDSGVDCIPVSVLSTMTKNLKSTNNKIFFSGTDKIMGSRRKI